MKKIIAAALSLALVFSLSGCGSKKNDSKKIVIGATPVPHKEILEEVKPLLEKKGYEVEIKEFTDYVTPNTALNQEDLDANFFQHIPYLKDFNEKKSTKLTYTAKVHIEPMGLYSKSIVELKDIKEGSEIAIPNDTTNGSRALKLLEAHGLIKLKDVEFPSILDIKQNEKNLKITELDAPQLPRVLDEVTAAVINTNYALEADLNPIEDAIVLESKDSPYANVLAIKEGRENEQKIKDLTEIINSKEIKTFIEEKYEGSIVPAF